RLNRYVRRTSVLANSGPSRSKIVRLVTRETLGDSTAELAGKSSEFAVDGGRSEGQEHPEEAEVYDLDGEPVVEEPHQAHERQQGDAASDSRSSRCTEEPDRTRREEPRLGAEPD